MSIKKFYTDVQVNGNFLAEGISVIGAYTLPSIDGTSGQVLTTDGLGSVTWQTPPSGASLVSITVNGARKSTSTNVYLNQEEVSMFTVPFILSDDCELLYMSASSDTIGTWIAEVHVNGVLVSGAQISVTSAKKAYIKFSPTIAFLAGDEVQLYCNGSNVSKPRISATFVAYQ